VAASSNKKKTRGYISSFSVSSFQYIKKKKRKEREIEASVEI